MLQLHKITDPATPEFLWAWQLYKEAFPEPERRQLSQQVLLLQSQHYQFLAISSGDVLVSLIGLWQVPGFTFLEHFAVSPSLRGQGVGKMVLALLQAEFPRPWVLEVEPPLTELAQRRINFYERAGFHLNTFPYQQPPYSQEKPWVPLLLMSFPEVLSEVEFQEVVKVLYQRVYNVAS